MRCPYCDAVLDQHSEISGDMTKKPKIGDFSSCIYCGNILVMGENDFGEINDFQMSELKQTDFYIKLVLTTSALNSVVKFRRSAHARSTTTF